MLSKLEFSTSLIKLISSFFTQRELSVSVKGEKVQEGVPHGSVLSSELYSMYINDTP
jgi:hypothetical protein